MNPHSIDPLLVQAAPMFSHKFSDEVRFETHFHWFLLSFLAGSINAGGFMACARFVSHVTGFATISGRDLSRGHIGEALGVLSIPAFFTLGVMVSAYLTEKSSADRSGSKFAPVMGLVAICLGLVALGGAVGWFGEFGSPANLRHDYVLLALLCGACGLQNAAISSASGATIRTTHLTGITTDLGLGIVRAEIHSTSPDQRRRERKANLLRLGTIFAFFLGSSVGAVLYLHFHYLAFLFPMVIAIYAATISAKINTAGKDKESLSPAVVDSGTPAERVRSKQ